MSENTGRKVEKDPEVVQKAERRRFTAEYKQRIALEAENCSEPSQIGALLRREGLYSSMLQRWRRQLREKPYGIIKKVQRKRQTNSSPGSRTTTT